jgi:hypothetical protein
MPQDLLDDVKLAGVVKLENEFRAYLTVKNRMDIYKVGDQIRSYTVTAIDMDKVTLKSGKKEIVKQRGKK